MGKFEGFDWGTFWDDSEYALESHVGKEPTDEEIKEIEDELGYKLPESYIELIKKIMEGYHLLQFFLLEKQLFILKVFMVLIKRNCTRFVVN